MKGVDFGGIKDKQVTRVPNDGNECAYPRCSMKNIPEGWPARFAHGDPTLWCHTACAQRWELEEPNFKQNQQPAVEEPQLPVCGAPHPELHDFTCSKPDHSQGPNHYHNDGAGHSWYMQPAQVETLKMQIAARNPQVQQEVPGDQVDYVGPEIVTPSGRNTAEPSIKLDASQWNAAQAEYDNGVVRDDHKCCEHCGPGGHAPHTAGCPVPEVQHVAEPAPEAEPVKGPGDPTREPGDPFAVDEADLRPPAEHEVFDVDSYAQARMKAEDPDPEWVPTPQELDGIKDQLDASPAARLPSFLPDLPDVVSDSFIGPAMAAEAISSPSQAVRLTLDLIAVLANHGIHNNDLVAEIMEWRAR